MNRVSDTYFPYFPKPIIRLLLLYPNDLQWFIDLYSAKTKSMQATESWIDLEKRIRLMSKYYEGYSYQSIPTSPSTRVEFGSVAQTFKPFAKTDAWTADNEYINRTNTWDALFSSISTLIMVASLTVASAATIAFRNIDNILSELLLNSSMILYSVYSLLSHRARTRIMSISIGCQNR